MTHYAKNLITGEMLEGNFKSILKGVETGFLERKLTNEELNQIKNITNPVKINNVVFGKKY